MLTKGNLMSISNESRVRASQQRAREAMNLARKNRPPVQVPKYEFKGSVQAVELITGGVRGHTWVKIWVSSPTGDSSDSLQFEIPCSNESQAKAIMRAWATIWEIPAFERELDGEAEFAVLAGYPHPTTVKKWLQSNSEEPCESCGGVGHFGDCYDEATPTTAWPIG
jgi:hypothetical protein